MPTRVSPPASSAIVEIADEMVGAYVAQGWVVAVAPVVAKVVEVQAKRGPGRPSKSEK